MDVAAARLVPCVHKPALSAVYCTKASGGGGFGRLRPAAPARRGRGSRRGPAPATRRQDRHVWPPAWPAVGWPTRVAPAIAHPPASKPTPEPSTSGGRTAPAETATAS